MCRLPVLLSLFAMILPAQVLVMNPKQCTEAGLASPIMLEEPPLKVHFHAEPDCIATNDKGTLIRVWKYTHRYQRLAAPKPWKVVVDKGDGNPATYPMPHNSIIGVFLHQKDSAGKWKAYRGNSKNPIALTQPPVLFTIRKASETGSGGLKTEYLVWDVMSVDPLGVDMSKKDSAAAFPMPAEASDLRVEQIWVWQGLNPIAKKINAGSAKAKITIQPE